MKQEELSEWRIDAMDALFNAAAELSKLRPGGDWSAFKEARRELVRVLHEDEAIIARGRA